MIKSFPVRAILAGAALISGALATSANTPSLPFLYDPSNYGKVQIPLVESTGNAAAYIATHKGAFEPVNELLTNDALRVISKPIGRIDILIQREGGDQAMGTCTGTLLAGNYVLTNHHCLPQTGARRILKASIVMDFLTQGGDGSKRFEINVTPEEWNEGLDYAIAKVDGNPTAAFGYARVSATAAQPGEGMIIFHHPLGRPRMMTRFRCLALRKQPESAHLRHRCDTMPGSSGSLILNNRFETVGLHFAGGLNPNEDDSFNLANSMAAIIAQSALLKRIISEQAPAAVQAPVQGVSKSTNGQAASPTRSDSAEEMSKHLLK